MRYVHNELVLIMIVEDDDAVIQTQNTVVEFNTNEEAIQYFEEHNIDYSILGQNQ